MKILKKFNDFVNENIVVDENNDLTIDNTPNNDLYKIIGEKNGNKNIYDSSNDKGQAEYLLSNFIEAFDETYNFYIEDKDGNKIDARVDDVNDADVVKENKLNETGEWDKNVDWQYVKDNPDSVEENEFASMIKGLELLLDEVIDFLPENFPFIIKDIRGFDIYQGAYANVNINGKYYKIWQIEHDEIWIENYPFDNTSSAESTAGLQGSPLFVAEKIQETENI